MFKLLIAAVVAVSAPLPQRTIVVDNRGLCPDTASRIAEGERKQGMWTAQRLSRKLEAQGIKARIVVLEAGEPADFSFHNAGEVTTVLVRNGGC